MVKKFNIHDWQYKQRLDEQSRKDTPGGNPDAFYGDDSLIGKLKKDPDYIKKLNAKSKSTVGDEMEKWLATKPFEKDQESMSNADIKALQVVVGNYSLNTILSRLAVIVDKTGKHDEAEMIKNLSSKIQPELDEANMTGTGASFSAGAGEGYATPHAFARKGKWKGKKTKYQEQIEDLPDNGLTSYIPPTEEPKNIMDLANQFKQLWIDLKGGRYEGVDTGEIKALSEFINNLMLSLQKGSATSLINRINKMTL